MGDRSSPLVNNVRSAHSFGRCRYACPSRWLALLRSLDTSRLPHTALSMVTTCTVLASLGLVAAAAAKHDIMMIAVDDMRNEQGFYGCGYMKTPHMDALAKKSLVFERMYTGVAVCAPSRTILLTGRRPDTSRVWTISPREYWRASGGNFTTLPQYFKDEGDYLTLGTGKIFHPGGPSGGSPRWPGSTVPISPGGSDTHYSWSPECLPYKNSFTEPPQDWGPGAGAGGQLYSSPAIHPFFNVTDDQMAEGQLATNAVRLLKLIKTQRSGGSTKPFFTAFGFHRPHIPWHAPEKYYKMYDDPHMPVAPNQHLPVDVPDIAVSEIFTSKYMPEDTGRCSCYVSSMYDGNRSCCGTYCSGPKPGGYPGNYTARSYWDSFHDLHEMKKTEWFPHDNTTLEIKDQQAIRQAYRAALSFTDRNIGVVLAGLDEMGFSETTIVAMWADHGYQLGDNAQYAKHTNFEHATRIPFMVHLPTKLFPHFKPGRTTAFVENIDLYPSLVELALGVTVPRCPEDVTQSRITDTCTEGLSFAPLLGVTPDGAARLKPTPRQWKSASFSQYQRLDETIMGYSARVDGYRYTEWVEFNRSTNELKQSFASWDKTVGVELYKHDDEVDASTGGLVRGCNWAMEGENLANQPAYADVAKKLAGILRAGWRNALPPSHA